jgi:hypothetical protein
MLAGTEEAFQAEQADKSEEEMTALQTLLTGLFDYAGLYPPASLSLRSAANNYLEYSRGEHASALGRFIINSDRLEELRSVAGESLGELKLSVIVSEVEDLDLISDEILRGMPIDAVEIKCAQAGGIKRMAARVPQPLTVFFEVPLDERGPGALEVISTSGMRAKIRMGGVVPEAFPSLSAVVQILEALTRLRLAFKATAGLHHPIRSCRPLTYEAQSAKGTMYGFLNLLCAAAAVYFGGQLSDAEKILWEEDSSAWKLSPDTLQWRHLKWTQDQLSTLRREFFISIGSCSFEEPIQDLYSMGWL